MSREMVDKILKNSDPPNLSNKPQFDCLTLLFPDDPVSEKWDLLYKTFIEEGCGKKR